MNDLRLMGVVIRALAVVALVSGCAGRPVGPAMDVLSPTVEMADTIVSTTASRATVAVLAGELAGRRGDLQAAATYTLEAATMTGDRDLARRATQLAFSAEDDALAARAAELWVALEPDSREASSLALRARIAAGRATVDDLDAWLNTADDLPTAEQQLAGVLGLASPDADAALNVLAELESRRQSAGLAYALAFLALRYERVDRALEALDRAERRGWDPVACDELRLRAQLAREDGEAVSAVAQRLRSAYREDRAAALAVGQLLLDAQAWTLAREQFAFVAQFWPQDPAARMALGLLDAQSGALASAREQFLALWETGARNDEAAWQLGRLAGLEKRWSDAASWFERVEDGGRYLDAQLGLAQVRAEQGDIPAARAQLSMLRDQQPEDAARLWRAEAEILQKAGQADAAMDLLDAAIADTQALDLYYQRALLHDTRGDLESARADLQFIIDRDADNAAALNALGYMLADDNRELALARQLIERALALRPDDPAIRDSLGWVLYRQGELAAAEEALQAAYAVYPDPEVAAHLGEVLWHRGRLAEARQVLSEAIRATPSHPKLLRAWMQFGQP